MSFAFILTHLPFHSRYILNCCPNPEQHLLLSCVYTPLRRGLAISSRPIFIKNSAMKIITRSKIGKPHHHHMPRILSTCARTYLVGLGHANNASSSAMFERVICSTNAAITIKTASEGIVIKESANT